MATPDQAYEAVLEARFSRLVAEWRAAAEFLSSSTAMVALPSYRAIVALGSKAVPMLLKEMQARPDHWCAALNEITGATPSSEADAGDVQRLAEVWVAWGRRQGLIE